ncbi:MAG TPA: nucleotidyltransferase family protein [Pyrinomonadaceae bacterium]
MSKIAAILLAAGRSRRMGAFKPLLPFGEKTVAESCIEYLLDGGVESIVVVLGHRAEELRGRLEHLPVIFTLNPEAESEMSASIARGAVSLPARTAAVLIALCDQPAIPPEVVSRLIEERERTGGRLIVPEFEGRIGHPVLLDFDFREELLKLDARGGLRSLFEKQKEEVVRVPVGSPYVARDMDTWDDYRALYEDVFHQAPPAAR